MKKHCPSLFVVGLTIALASCSHTTTEPLTSRQPMAATSSVKSGSKGLADQLFQEVNLYRASIGQSRLKRHSGLDRLAQEHSEYLKANRGKFSLHGKNVSHVGFAGRSLAAKRMMNMEEISENVVAGNSPGGLSARQMVEGWKKSPSHNANLRQGWMVTGVGVAVDADGHVFATQLYATPGVSTSRWSGPQTSF